MPNAPETTQDPAAEITYEDDWTDQLAGLGFTITAGSVTATGGAVVSDITPIPTGVRFKLFTAGVTTVPSVINVTTTVTLSNGDVDRRKHLIQVSYT